MSVMKAFAEEVSDVRSTSKRLIVASVIYLIVASVATAVAIAQDRPAEFAGMRSGLPVLQDWLYGYGTALSPTFYIMVLQAILTLLVLRPGRWGKVGVGGLTIFGLIFTIGAAGEPIAREVFSAATFDPLLAAIQAGMIGIPFVMVLFGVVEWRRRSQPV